MKIGVVTPRMASGERGGAEVFYEGLVSALQAAGHDATEVPVHTDESTFDRVLESYARCYSLDLRDYDLVISTKAPTFMVSHPNHVSYLVHTLRVFYDMFETEYGGGTVHAARAAPYRARPRSVRTSSRPRAPALQHRQDAVAAAARRLTLLEVCRVSDTSPGAGPRGLQAAQGAGLRPDARSPPSMEARRADDRGLQASETQCAAAGHRAAAKTNKS
jgi:hypothetical protein